LLLELLEDQAFEQLEPKEYWRLLLHHGGSRLAHGRHRWCHLSDLKLDIDQFLLQRQLEHSKKEQQL
jgi:hypothetical protein